MDDITWYMSRMRRDSDRHFAKATSAASCDDWDACDLHVTAFVREMEMHFGIEESILFPAFEEETGGDTGLTRRMALEHLRLRELTQQLLAATQRKNKAEYLRCASTLASVLQHHNTDEEQFLYPMIEDLLAEQCSVLKADIDDMLDGV